VQDSHFENLVRGANSLKGDQAAWHRLLGFYRHVRACGTALCRQQLTRSWASDVYWTLNTSFSTAQCSALQHTAKHCNTLQHTATHCNTLQNTATHCKTLQHTATHCNTLQHTATHCNTLQHTAKHFFFETTLWLQRTLQHTASHCITLQHTATHCNVHCNILQHTMQHTATVRQEDSAQPSSAATSWHRIPIWV